MEYETVTVELGASAMSNISYRFKKEVDVELDELEGMDRNQIWQHLYDEYLLPAIMEDIDAYIPNIDEIAEAVKKLDE